MDGIGENRGQRRWSCLRRFIGSPLLTVALRIILGALFVWASWDKILHPERFAEDVANYALLPLWLINVWTLVLPWIEMFTGLFLMVGILTRSSSLLISALLVSFILAISFNMIRGAEIDCGCFGAGEELGWETLLRDFVMLAMGLQILFCDRGLLTLDSLWAKRRKGGR